MTDNKKLINPKNKAVTVFGGSMFGNSPAYVEQTEEMARLMLDAGIENIIYGGSSSGIMGTFANYFKDNGGTVIEISTEIFFMVDRAMEKESRANYRIITKDLPFRKHLMMTGGIGLADVRLSSETSLQAEDFFCNIKVVGAVALPGGTGTDDEIYEIIARDQAHSIKLSVLKENYKMPRLPLVILNVNGVFDFIPKTIHHKIEHGFTNERDFRHFRMWYNAKDAVSDLVDIMNKKETNLDN